MKIQTSLIQRFASLLFLFVATTASVLYLLVSAKNEPIDFAKLELKGNLYQQPLERVLRALMQHRILVQRSFSENSLDLSRLHGIQKQVDDAFAKLTELNLLLKEDLKFTDEGLSSRKRDHYRIETAVSEWSRLKGQVGSLKASESSDLHKHLISDIRTMITHVGDTSNLILDPDLDSYYLMDMTLLALPQTQDRIQSVIAEIGPIFQSKSLTLEDRIKASVFVSMMMESDFERLKADYQTVLNEDSNFYGKSETLEEKITPAHNSFISAYKDLIGAVAEVAKGEPGSTDKFIEISNRALDESFEYWNVSSGVLDTLLKTRVASIERSKAHAAVISIFSLILSLGIAYLFMRHLTKNMSVIVDILRRSSTEVWGASAQSASSASKLSEATTEQAASLQETMASIEEISAMVSQNADSALKTKSAVDGNQSVSELGSRSIDEMLDAIGEIKNTNEEILSQMEGSNREFGEIAAIIAEIGMKTNVINEIVFQTKLLSFNASVEAARAGEHGKGFAVVAEEVGNLAQMSGNAAKEITGMLSESINKVNSIVENTKSRVDDLLKVGKEKIILGQMTAEKCQQSLNEITENARTVASMITEISHASREQAQGVQEINKAITQLDQVTGQNSSIAQNSSEQAERLSAEANSLKEAVSLLVTFVDGKRQVSDEGAEFLQTGS